MMVRIAPSKTLNPKVSLPLALSPSSMPPFSAHPWRHMRKTILFLILMVPLFAAAQPQPAKPNAPQKFKLPASPKTVAWGYYDAAAPPVLRIHSGDTVVFDTLITNSPIGLEKAGVPPDQVEQSLRDI